jgi:hypothetical protein
MSGPVPDGPAGGPRRAQSGDSTVLKPVKLAVGDEYRGTAPSAVQNQGVHVRRRGIIRAVTSPRPPGLSTRRISGLAPRFPAENRAAENRLASVVCGVI